ncbi:MAG: hypothetical protein ACR2NU_01315 [Aeoliella sp.]
MNTRLATLVLIVVTLSAIGEPSFANGLGFDVGVFAVADIGERTVEFAPNVESSPAIVDRTFPGIGGIFPPGFHMFASADFTSLDVSLTAVGREFPGVGSSSTASDTLSIIEPNYDSGSTRLEMTWRVRGEIVVNRGVLLFSSLFARNDFECPGIDAGQLSVGGVGEFDQLVTFVYDDVPVGSPWNLQTSLVASASFASTTVRLFEPATLSDVEFFVDDLLVSAAVVGVSGTVYRVPESSSLELTTMLGLISLLCIRRSYA